MQQHYDRCRTIEPQDNDLEDFIRFTDITLLHEKSCIPVGKAMSPSCHASSVDKDMSIEETQKGRLPDEIGQTQTVY